MLFGEEVLVKILITGGCGFIGSHVAERFFKEGNEICVIDNLSTGFEKNLTMKHKFYNLNVVDPMCEEIFRTNNIDCVVHLAAQVDVTISNQNAYLDSESNILGLVNMLELSAKYGVKKFIFASSAAVYGDTEALPISENEPSNPLSVYGMNKSLGEYYCQQWKQIYNLETVVLRFANVYGPRQGIKGESGVISKFMQQIMDKQEIVVYGDGQQTRDYIFVEDVVDAIYRSVSNSFQETIMNVSTNQEHSLMDLLDMLSKFDNIKNIRYQEKKQGDIYKSRLDNTCIKGVLSWEPKYSLQDGLLKTYQWYQANWSKQSTAVALSKESKATPAWRSYVENLGLFSIMAALSYVNLHGTIDAQLGLDYNYIYIGIMGILYGKRQSMLATVLSIGIFVSNVVARGGDIIGIMYQAQYLIHLAAYLSIGVVTGFVSDNGKRVAHDKKLEMDSLTARYDFLRKMYLDCNQIKDEIHSQIINSSDSIGKLYSIIRELGSLRIEDTYTAAIGVIGKIMQTNSIALYTVSKGETYLRLKVKSNEFPDDMPNSIKIEDHKYIKEIMVNKGVFVNKDLQPDSPIMAAPIVYEDKVIAVLQISHLPFEKVTLYYEHLFGVTMMLIADAFTKAYLYDRDLQDKKYIANTGILNVEEFSNVINEIESRRESYPQEILLLQITEKTSNYERIDQTLWKIVRDEDYVGLKEDGHIYILMLNVSVDMAEEVRQRLDNLGLETTIELGDENA
jgi:UDP-glucuronate decarboxylase